MTAQRVSGSPAGLRFGVDDINGVFVLPPTPALPGANSITARDTVDLAATEAIIRKLLGSGVDGIMTTGTLGEMATLMHAEWKAFVDTVAETVLAVNADFPVFIGATTLNTRETAERIEYIRGVGLRGVLLGRPMWSPLGPDTMFTFYESLASAFPDMSFVLYDNPEAFRGPIPVPVYARLAKVPGIIGVKGAAMTPKFRADVTAAAGGLRMMPIEVDWLAASTLFPDESQACWSGSAMLGPEPVLFLRDALRAGDVEAARWATDRMEWTYDAHPGRSNFAEFSKYNIPIEKHRFDAAGYVSAGPTRPPYDVFPESYIEATRENARRWREVVADVVARQGADPAAKDGVAERSGDPVGSAR
jgi:dihydrodipicolinate synthase/N-acetylneuraminate lyase